MGDKVLSSRKLLTPSYSMVFSSLAYICFLDKLQSGLSCLSFRGIIVVSFLVVAVDSRIGCDVFKFHTDHLAPLTHSTICSSVIFFLRSSRWANTEMARIFAEVIGRVTYPAVAFSAAYAGQVEVFDAIKSVFIIFRVTRQTVHAQ